MKGIIYKTTNLITNKIYIGQTITNNKNYLGSGIYFLKSLKKYGRENFKREILESVNDLKLLDEKEIYWIKKLNSTDPKIGYNINDGGQGVNKKCSKHTKEWKEMMSKKNSGSNNPFFGKKHSEASKKKMSKSIKESQLFKDAVSNPERLKKQKERMTGKNNPNYGKKISEKQKQILRDTHKNKIVSEKTKQKLSDALKGRKLSETHKKKIGNAHRNKIVSEETKNKISLSNTGKVKSQKEKDKISKSMKKAILEIIDNKINRRWESAKEAHLDLNVSIRSIQYICRKRNIENKLKLIYEKDFK